MEQRYGTACGVDVHKKILVATIKDGKDLILTGKFGTSTKDILRMADWIQANHVEMTMMESTGCYWKPVYNILDGRLM